MNAKEILEKNNFKFEKKFGQNFITDGNLLAGIVADCNITKETNILEIGPGAGTLTKKISEKANKVLCFEIDKNLKPILEETLKECNNVEVVFKDVMQVGEQEINEKLGEKYSLVANLPYYITTPILFKFLPSKNINKIAVMVQKEVAERIVAKREDGKNYGILSVMVSFFGEAKIARIVNRNMFMPAPNVDSAIVIIEKQENKFKCNYSVFEQIVRTSFAMRRKTLVNNLMSGLNLSREEAINLIAPLNEKVRPENLSIENFVDLANKYENIKK